MADALILHEDPCSGNCHKIKLTAALLGIPLELRQYDISKGETRTPEFLAGVNPHGRIPVLQVGTRFLPESNAACWFLAEGSRLIPNDPFARADMLRWMFFEQYSHEPNVATLRFWMKFVGEDALTEQQRFLVPLKRAAGEEALALLDRHLQARSWMVGETISLADVVLYPYTSKCAEGGFSLDGFAAIRDWIDRIESAHGFIAME